MLQILLITIRLTIPILLPYIPKLTLIYVVLLLLIRVKYLKINSLIALYLL